MIIKKWLEQNHPDILKEFNLFKSELEKKIQRERARELYRLAREAKKQGM